MSTLPRALPPTIRFALTLSWAFRTMLDRIIPAGLFGFLGLSRMNLLIQRLGQAPATDEGQALVVYRLDVAHQTLASVFLVLVGALCLTRKAPLTQRAGLLPIVVALAGTFIMAFPATQPRITDDRWLLTLAGLLIIAGLAYAIYAVSSLRSCFGLAAEARGLVTSGAYRQVRHPVYLGELIAALGVLLPVLTPLTGMTFVLFVAAQGYRIHLEERVLSAAFEDYDAYRRRVPLLVPWPRPTS
ncbi:MAG TPA: isoprenylcysteine carboxylmethyltransferase family protein [Chloroflexota bacterium]|nr:isoprenylcysteine carboxylmethyltransferase family protein [Chloroflexota bacterium]